MFFFNCYTRVYTDGAWWNPAGRTLQRRLSGNKRKMGRRLHMSRSAQKRNKPSRALVLDPVSPMDNRGCFHAASVLTTVHISSFLAELQPSTSLRTPLDVLRILREYTLLKKIAGTTEIIGARTRSELEQIKLPRLHLGSSFESAVRWASDLSLWTRPPGLCQRYPTRR